MNKPAPTPADPGREVSPSSATAQRRIPLSAIVLTLDEEVNIARCLGCLDRVEDVIVVDSGSTDSTLALAREARHDVRIFEHAFQDFGDQRNWAIDNTSPKHDWILFVDADEFCTPELLDEIDQFLRSPGEHVGALIAGKNFFLGRWLKHSTAYPSYQLRLLKAGRVRYVKDGHGQREVTNGPICRFKENWIHESFSKGVAQWIERHNIYSSEEAKFYTAINKKPMTWSEISNKDPNIRKQSYKKLWVRLPFRPVLRFIQLWIINKGVLDGYPGLLFCLLVMAHHIHINAKIEEESHISRR